MSFLPQYCFNYLSHKTAEKEVIPRFSPDWSRLVSLEVPLVSLEIRLVSLEARLVSLKMHLVSLETSRVSLAPLETLLADRF